MNNFIALLTIIIWPVIPLIWIPVHLMIGFSKRTRAIAYLLSIFSWIALAYLLYKFRMLLISFKAELPFWINIIGFLLLFSGTILHIWTGMLLRLKGLIGFQEISHRKGKLVIEGPFSVVRHPTYFAHTLMFLGVFLLTEVVAVGIVTFLDFVIVNIVIIPLEEREIAKRFGMEYEIYRRKVKSRFIPWGWLK